MNSTDLYFSTYIKVFLGIIFSSLVGFANQPQISSYSVLGASEIQMMNLTKKFEIRSMLEGEIEVMVPVARTQEFLSLAPSAKLVLADVSAPVRSAFQLSRILLSRGDNRYHSFEEVAAILRQTAANNPGITNLVTYGYSSEKRPLLALRISNRLRGGAKVPRIMLTAATHGDEIITTEVLLNLMNEILLSSRFNRGLGNILDQIELVIIPVVNPDGFSEQNRYENGEDPNRSYPYPDEPNQKPTPSIDAIIQFTQQYPIAGSIDFHAYGRLIMYPWGYTRQPLSPDAQKVFETVTAKMAAQNSYVHGQISRVIYVAPGSSCDFYYWKWNSLSLGIEVGNSKAPPASAIPNYVQEQRASTMLFLQSFH